MVRDCRPIGVTLRRLDAARGLGRQLGFLAQDVEKVLPELITTAKDGLKSVAYASFVPLLVEAIKAQQAEITALKAQVKAAADLKDDLAALRAEVRAMKGTLARR